MINKPCLLGVHPETKECLVSAVNTPENAEFIRREGLICVPVSRKASRRGLHERIDDVYALAQQQDQEEAA